MHVKHHEQHKTTRVQKIVNIFGTEWFAGKSILELGACHGDIGIEFIKLGAAVTFCDVREENLNVIKNKIVNPNIVALNQNRPYNLNQKFDLILHLGTLWHLENWYNDLYHAMKHSDQMILETTVWPKKGKLSFSNNLTESNPYSALNSKESIFTSDILEDRLHSLNLRYTRYDDSDLNTDYLPSENNTFIKNVYDWTDELFSDNTNQIIHHKRFYLISRDNSSVG